VRLRISLCIEDFKGEFLGFLAVAVEILKLINEVGSRIWERKRSNWDTETLKPHVATHDHMGWIIRKRGVFAVLHQGLTDSPHTAVRVPIVSDFRKRKG
jgi:hypothetical protein